MWIKCILDYCKNSGFTEVNIESFPLFENKTIGSSFLIIVQLFLGSLDMEMRKLLMNTLCQQGSFFNMENDL